MGLSKLDSAKAIFVDYFDTLVFRKVSAKELLGQWAECLQKKYPSLSNETKQALPAKRLQCFRVLREKAVAENCGKTEVTYEEAIGLLFQEVQQELGNTDKTEFTTTAKNIDLSLECGCQYANRKLVRLLLDQKKKGKKIYCVSDFYLDAGCFREMMKAANVPEGLIENVFVSCDFGKRKATGDLYGCVLSQLNLQPADVTMIGDNPKSDYENARASGLQSVLQRRIPHKAVIHVNRKIGAAFCDRQMKFSMDDVYRHGQNYAEYIGIFYVFTRRLFRVLKENDISSVAFMAREGFYLKRLFELYQEIAVPKEQWISTSYYWCSRRSVMAGIRKALMPEFLTEEINLKNWLKSVHLTTEDARKFISFEEEEAEKICVLKDSDVYQHLIANKAFKEELDKIISSNEEAFRQYTDPYIHNGVFCFVDSGWKCTTQDTIQYGYGIQTKGYYIGVQNPDKPIGKLEKRGLIFQEADPRSKYYDYLGTNIPFYQQLLAAPHGTAVKYVKKGSEIEVLHEWDPMEEDLYTNHIAGLQEYMLLKFRGLCAWDNKDAWDQKQDWYIARLSMRSSLFANRSRQQFIRMCTDNYVQNFRQENRGKVKYDPKKVKLGADLLWKPEKYLRYFSKIQRTSVYDHALVKAVYPVFAHVYYGYTLLLHCMKR